MYLDISNHGSSVVIHIIVISLLNTNTTKHKIKRTTTAGDHTYFLCDTS